jgi:hypothetical protein
VCINLLNVSGESIECYVCNTLFDAECSDFNQKIKTTECTKPALLVASSKIEENMESFEEHLLGFREIPEIPVLKEAYSVVRKGVESLGNHFDSHGITEGHVLREAYSAVKKGVDSLENRLNFQGIHERLPLKEAYSAVKKGVEDLGDHFRMEEFLVSLALKEAVKNGVDSSGDHLGSQGIPEELIRDVKSACVKIDLSGKRL